MKKNRRDFLRLSSIAGIGLAGARIIPTYASTPSSNRRFKKVVLDYAKTTLEDGSVVSTPFWRIDSGNKGPALALIAAQHGNEVQGTEVARRFKEVCERQIVAGSVWILPMANLLAIRSRKHSFNLGPEENNSSNPNKLHNMQKHWPGDPKGNNTARLAYSLDQDVLRHCSYLVDMHCWNHFAAAETLSEEKHMPSRAMGEVATTRFISYRNSVIPQHGKMTANRMMLKRGGSALVMELSGQFQMQERQIQIGLSSMVNIAKLLGIINGEPKLTKDTGFVRSSETLFTVNAPCSGIFMSALKKDKSATLIPDDYIEEGQQLGHIIRESDLETIPVISPVSGYILQLCACHWGLCDASLPAQHPYTDEGERVARIVTV